MPSKTTRRPAISIARSEHERLVKLAESQSGRNVEVSEALLLSSKGLVSLMTRSLSQEPFVWDRPCDTPPILGKTGK